MFLFLLVSSFNDTRNIGGYVREYYEGGCDALGELLERGRKKEFRRASLPPSLPLSLSLLSLSLSLSSISFFSWSVTILLLYANRIPDLVVASRKRGIA